MKFLSVILGQEGGVKMTKNERELLEMINKTIFFLKEKDVNNVNSSKLKIVAYDK